MPMPVSLIGLARRATQLVALATAGVCAVVVLAHSDALRAAGVTGKAPPNAGAIKTFVAEITDNLLWIIGTVSTLAIVIVGALFFFGYSRAGDLAIRIGVGALFVVAAGGIAA
jgi:hypothetical protein